MPWRLAREARKNCSHIEPEDEDDAALERFLRRRTGAAATDAQRLREIGTYATYAAGETVCRTTMSRERLFVVLDGVVRAAFRYEGDAMLRSTKLRSGELFDLRLLNLAWCTSPLLL